MYPEGPEMERILVATAARPQVDSDHRLGGRQYAMTPTAAQSEQRGSTLPENRY
jgi:hypothetical protein